jgi:hypothetical protein
MWTIGTRRRWPHGSLVEWDVYREATAAPEADQQCISGCAEPSAESMTGYFRCSLRDGAGPTSQFSQHEYYRRDLSCRTLNALGFHTHRRVVNARGFAVAKTPRQLWARPATPLRLTTAKPDRDAQSKNEHERGFFRKGRVTAICHLRQAELKFDDLMPPSSDNDYVRAMSRNRRFS